MSTIFGGRPDFRGSAPKAAEPKASTIPITMTHRRCPMLAYLKVRGEDVDEHPGVTTREGVLPAAEETVQVSRSTSPTGGTQRPDRGDDSRGMTAIVVDLIRRHDRRSRRLDGQRLARVRVRLVERRPRAGH